MTLHLHIPPKQKRPRCDTRALAELRARVRADLESDKIERQISRQLVDKHNRHIQASNNYRQQGGE